MGAVPCLRRRISARLVKAAEDANHEELKLAQQSAAGGGGGEAGVGGEAGSVLRWCFDDNSVVDLLRVICGTLSACESGSLDDEM